MPYDRSYRPNTPTSLVDGNNADRRRMVAGATAANGAPDNGTTDFYCSGYERVILEAQAVGTSAYYDVDVWFRYAASGLWICDANVGTRRINSVLLPAAMGLARFMCNVPTFTAATRAWPWSSTARRWLGATPATRSLSRTATS